MNKNWLIVLLMLLGAGLVMFKNRERSAPAPIQETTTPEFAQAPAPISPETEQITAEQTPAQKTAQKTQEQAKPTPEITKSRTKSAVQENIEAAAIEPTKHEEQAHKISKEALQLETAQPIAPAQKSAPVTEPITPASSVVTTPKAGSQQAIAPSAEQTGEQRTVTVENAITKKMLGYRYFGTHYPTAFKVTANGKEIKQESKDFIKITNNQLTVRYSFEFLNGQRKGAKEITFAIKPKTETLTLAFDWKDSWRIIIDKDKAEPMSAKQID